MIVSFLIPTRQRLQALLEGVQSIKENASPDVQLEFLVRIDDNDYETLAGRDHIPGKIIVGPRWHGYNSVSTFLNELAAKSHGDWITPWNDDMFMQTHHWDKLLPTTDRAQIIWACVPGSNSYVIPIMSRRLYDLWGCYAPPCTPSDICIFQICKAAGKPLPPEDHSGQIVIIHKRDPVNIGMIAIRPEDVVSTPKDPNMKGTDELTRLLRDAP